MNLNNCSDTSYYSDWTTNKAILADISTSPDLIKDPFHEGFMSW